SGVRGIQGDFDPVQSKWSTTERDLRAVFHIPEALAGAGDSFCGRTGKGPALDGVEQSLKFHHLSKARMHVSQFSEGAVRDGSTSCVGGRLAEFPSFTPHLQRFGIMTGVVVLESKIRQQRNVPRARWVGFEKTVETGEIIRTGTFRIIKQRCDQSGILGLRGFSSDWHQRLLEKPYLENLLRCKVFGVHRLDPS